MAERSELLDYLIGELAPLGDARGRAMFGGHGVYLDGLIIGIIAYDSFYLKVDGGNRPDFEAAGSEPFVYDGKDRPIVMPYWTCPAEVLEDGETLRIWALAALAASRRSRRPSPLRVEPAPAKKKRSPLRPRSGGRG